MNPLFEVHLLGCNSLSRTGIRCPMPPPGTRGRTRQPHLHRSLHMVGLQFSSRSSPSAYTLIVYGKTLWMKFHECHHEAAHLPMATSETYPSLFDFCFLRLLYLHNNSRSGRFCVPSEDSPGGTGSDMCRAQAPPALASEGTDDADANGLSVLLRWTDKVRHSFEEDASERRSVPSRVHWTPDTYAAVPSGASASG